jgi:hypothetical protein
VIQDDPEPSESEDELAATERHQDEEAMRGPEHQDSPEVAEDNDDDER